jgi:hypothetical protein
MQGYDVSRPDDLIDWLEQQAATPIRNASRNAARGTTEQATWQPQQSSPGQPTSGRSMRVPRTSCS